MIKQVKKVWGREEWLVNESLYCCKYLYLNNGFQCSLHYHLNKTETFYILIGKVKIEIGESRGHVTNTTGGRGCEVVYSLSNISERIMEAGEQIKLVPNIIHRFTAITSTAKILEVSTHHDDSDSYRIKDSGRIKI